MALGRASWRLRLAPVPVRRVEVGARAGLVDPAAVGLGALYRSNAGIRVRLKSSVSGL